MNMIQHPIIQLVLRMKWEMFAKNMYLADLFKYVIIMLSVAVAIALLPNDIQSRIHYTDSNGPARIVVEIIVLIGILDLIFGEIGELHTRGVMVN